MNNKTTSPWVAYAKHMSAILDADPAVKVCCDDNEPVITVYVNGQEKSDALRMLLPTMVSLGEADVKIEVVQADEMTVPEVDIGKLLNDAFYGNPRFKEVTEADGTDGTHYFVTFKNEVVQYFTDSSLDPDGFTSTLSEKLAYTIFRTPPGVCFCTELSTAAGKKEV